MKPLHSDHSRFTTPSLPLVWMVLWMTVMLPTLAAPPPAGVAPVAPPPNGFDIDGDLFANTPTPDVGDWLPNPPAGAGGSVLNAAGVPLNPGTTFHFVDPYNGNDNVFSGGLKWGDNPNTWTWTISKSSSKTDINNVMLHLTTDAEGHTWAVLSADRFSVNGDSYIDFELLQNSLQRMTNGTFVSAGPHGGRTVGDLLLSLAFTGGGKVANFFAWRWQPVGSGYGYVDVTDALPAGRVFVALNSNTVAVPYGAFGTTSYEANAFAEAAIDLTAMLGGFDPCVSVGFETIMIKTKASASSSASIEDFIDPIAYKLQIGPGADAGPDQARCAEGEVTSFTLNGTARPGNQPIATTTWSVISGDAVIESPGSLVTTVHVASATATLRLTVVQVNGCQTTDEVVLRVQTPPDCAIAGPSAMCPRATAQFQALPGMSEYAWRVSGNGRISGPTNQSTVTVVAGEDCGADLTVSLMARSNLCTVACAMEVTVRDDTLPDLICPPDVVLDCPAEPTTNVTGVATASDACSRVTVSYQDAVTPGCGNTRVIQRTWSATDECGNISRCVQTITIRDITPPRITCPPDVTLECPADPVPAVTGAAAATDECGMAVVGFSDSVNAGCGNTRVVRRTWTATDACGNTASCVQTITIRDTTPPQITCPPDVTLECPAETHPSRTGTATATDTCGAVSVTYTDSVQPGCLGTMTIRRTWTATDACGNTALCVQTITIRDTTPPILVLPANRVLDCPADTRTNVTGTATATDACGLVILGYSDVVSNACATTKTIWRTWTATDSCGNTTNGVQTIMVRDLTPPTLTCPPDRILDCPAETAPGYTGTATATDACGAVTITHTDSVQPGCGATRVIRRTWTATDECGNTSSCVQTITVRDVHAPSITCPPNLVLECPAVTTTNVTGVATAYDACSAVTLTYTDAISNLCGGAKLITRTWTATDACGNRASCAQTITLRDTTPPTLTVPPDRILECGANTSPSATGTATGQDTCSAVTISYTDTVSNQCGNTKTILRTWTATDACGNRTVGRQTIITRDTTPPAISCRVACTYSQGGWSGGGAPAQLLATHYTNVFPQGVMLGIYQPTNGNAAPNGLYWQPNAAGLTALQAAVSIGGGSGGPISRDAVNPTDTFGAGGLGRQTLALTFNIAFNEAGLIGAGPNDFGSLVYTKPGDSLSGKTVREILEAANRALAGLALPPGHDFSSLSGLLNNLNIAFHDCVPSAFATTNLSLPSIVVSCAAQIPPPNAGFVSASDTCGSVTLSVLPDVILEQTCPNRMVLARTWVARDACGNTNACIMRIVVNDTNPPALTVGPNRTVDRGTAWTFDPPSATDACGPVAIRIVSTITNAVAGGFAVTRTWEAVDVCGNAITKQQTITVRMPPEPVLEVVQWNASGLVIRWPADAGVYRLEATGDLLAGPWWPVEVTPVLSNGFYHVQFVPTDAQRFFRLSQGPPRLQVRPAAAGKLLLTWPTIPTGFQLESSDSCAPAVWSAVTTTPAVSNSMNRVEISPSTPLRFYRLRKAAP